VAKGATLQEAAARDCGFAKNRIRAARQRGRRDNEERRMSEFGRLITLEIPALRRYSRKLTRDPVAAEDLLQSCLLRALVKEELWRPGTDLRRWLFTMLYHQRVSTLRREARERSHLGEAVRALALSAAPDPNGRLLAGEIARAIAALPEGQREVVRHVALGGMGYAEAATALAVPEGTIRSRLARARIALRKLVEDDAAAGSAPIPPPASRAKGAAGRRLAA
jgi:RNA polymerase sigma-70 factor (ECF subfamily)